MQLYLQPVLPYRPRFQQSLACRCWRKAVAYSAARWNINYTHIPLCFDGHFLHVDRVYQNHVTIILDFIGARVTEVVSGGNRCCKTCKALVKSSVHQQTNTQLYTGRIPLPSPQQQRQNTEWKSYSCRHQEFLPHSVAAVADAKSAFSDNVSHN